MASNTEILIKRSLSNTAPSLLNQGELAYSYASNTLFIGTPDSDGAIEIGHYSDLANLVAGTYGDGAGGICGVGVGGVDRRVIGNGDIGGEIEATPGGIAETRDCAAV